MSRVYECTLVVSLDVPLLAVTVGKGFKLSSGTDEDIEDRE